MNLESISRLSRVGQSETIMLTFDNGKEKKATFRFRGDENGESYTRSRATEIALALYSACPESGDMPRFLWVQKQAEIARFLLAEVA